MGLYKQCGCGELIPINGKCEVCSKAKSKDKYSYESSNYKRLYHTTRWTRLRDKIRRRFRHMCVYCWAEGKVIDGKIVHHVIEANEDNFFDKDNLVLVCHECHEKIHSRYEYSNEENKKCKDELKWIKKRFEAELG